GVETHPRWAADRRLHVSLGEAHATSRHGIDVRRPQRRMAGTAEIIMAKLVAHDPQNVLLRARHLASLTIARAMLRYQAEEDKSAIPALTPSTAPSRPRPWPCRR